MLWISAKNLYMLMHQVIGAKRPGFLLILYKSGIFAIDTSIVNFQTWPRHRDNLGVYWKRQKRTYQSPSHPATSYMRDEVFIDYFLEIIYLLVVCKKYNNSFILVYFKHLFISCTYKKNNNSFILVYSCQRSQVKLFLQNLQKQHTRTSPLFPFAPGRFALIY
jgi:hypothetical protein